MAGHGLLFVSFTWRLSVCVCVNFAQEQRLYLIVLYLFNINMKQEVGVSNPITPVQRNPSVPHLMAASQSLPSSEFVVNMTPPCPPHPSACPSPFPSLWMHSGLQMYLFEGSLCGFMCCRIFCSIRIFGTLWPLPQVNGVLVIVPFLITCFPSFLFVWICK